VTSACAPRPRGAPARCAGRCRGPELQLGASRWRSGAGDFEPVRPALLRRELSAAEPRSRSSGCTFVTTNSGMGAGLRPFIRRRAPPTERKWMRLDYTFPVPSGPRCPSAVCAPSGNIGLAFRPGHCSTTDEPAARRTGSRRGSHLTVGRETRDSDSPKHRVEWAGPEGGSGRWKELREEARIRRAARRKNALKQIAPAPRDSVVSSS